MHQCLPKKLIVLSTNMEDLNEFKDWIMVKIGSAEKCVEYGL